MESVNKLVICGVPRADLQCPYCGKTLHQTVYKGSILTVYTPYFEECDCVGAAQHRAEMAADKVKMERLIAENTHRRKIEKLFADLRIPELYANCTLDNYNVPPGDKKALVIAVNYVKKFGELRQKGMGLYISGANGLGKTHLAYGIARGVAEQEHTVICKTAVDIMMDFRSVMDGELNDTEYEIMRTYVDCDLLIIDDLGKQQITDWSLAQLFGIIDARYRRRRPVIVTTNYPDTRLVARLALRSDGETAASIVSRLHGIAYDMPMTGRDYRSQ